MSIYHSVLLMTGNDAFPVGDIQVFFVVFSNTVGAIINANIFGNMAVLIQDLNRKQDASLPVSQHRDVKANVEFETACYLVFHSRLFERLFLFAQSKEDTIMPLKEVWQIAYQDLNFESIELLNYEN